jgi:ubiquitin carboxyl-terminal hydrolase 47
VSKLERDDIKKAFGTSFSTYSSTTAYMLLYRQINPKRNEQMIKVDELDSHLTELLAKEKRQELEADRLKEYMENVCKVKVIVPSFGANTTEVAGSGSDKQERTVDIHKDLSLDQAKEEILKEFGLAEILRETRQKCRILKYDTYNELIDQSYRDEATTSVFEALGFTKFPYGICWYLDVVPEEDEFLVYNHSDFNIKVVHLDMNTFEIDELVNLRVSNESTLAELRDTIAKVNYLFIFFFIILILINLLLFASRN